MRKWSVKIYTTGVWKWRSKGGRSGTRWPMKEGDFVLILMNHYSWSPTSAACHVFVSNNKPSHVFFFGWLIIITRKKKASKRQLAPLRKDFLTLILILFSHPVWAFRFCTLSCSLRKTCRHSSQTGSLMNAASGFSPLQLSERVGHGEAFLFSSSTRLH